MANAPEAMLSDDLNKSTISRLVVAGIDHRFQVISVPWMIFPLPARIEFCSQHCQSEPVFRWPFLFPVQAGAVLQPTFSVNPMMVAMVRFWMRLNRLLAA